MREAMLASGGMPEEVAKLTKVAGESGPVRTYHGTPNVFDQYDMSKMDKRGLYGPAIYQTESPEIASSYAGKGASKTLDKAGLESEIKSRLAETQGKYDLFQNKINEADLAITKAMEDTGLQWHELMHTKEHYPLIKQRDDLLNEAAGLGNEIGRLNSVQRQTHFNDDFLKEMPWINKYYKGSPENVRMQYMDARNPFDMEKTYPLDELTKIDNSMEGALFDRIPSGDVAKLLSKQMPGISGNRLYEAMQGYHRVGKVHEREAINKLLQKAGFDSITHQGGAVTGGDPHKVWLAFDQSQIYSPWVAPAAKAVPKLSPLAILLGAHNAGTLPYRSGVGRFGQLDQQGSIDAENEINSL